MVKETKSKVIMLFMITSILIIFAFQVQAEDLSTITTEIQETADTSTTLTVETNQEENTEDDNKPSSIPSTEDGSGDDFSF